MRIAYFDCFSGVSGNMILGALLSAGLAQADLEADLNALHLDGWQLQVTREVRKSIEGIHVQVVQTIHEHAHRNIHDIEAIVTRADLSEEIKEQAMRVFQLIAAAEGRVHGIPATEVHFHEVGAIDSIVDVVGAVAGLHRMGFDRVYASPIHVGKGFIEAAHGRLPVPAPATLEILRGAPIYSGDVYGELATPTGVAILQSVVYEYSALPQLVVEQIGYGLGTKDFPLPNALRLIIGSALEGKALDHDHSLHAHQHGHDHDVMQVLEANLDDMNPEFSQHVVNKLLEAGAVDAYYTSILMKKGRSALKLTVLCPFEAIDACVDTILGESTTLGVRGYLTERLKLQRSWVESTLLGEPVRIKLGKLNGKVVNIAPEYDDCLRIAQGHNVPLKQVYDQVKASAIALLQ